MDLRVRYISLGLLVVTIVVISVLIAKSNPPHQSASLAVVVDATTEVLRTADRVGLNVTRISLQEEIKIGDVMARKLEGRFGLPSLATQSVNPVSNDELYLQRLVDDISSNGRLRRDRIDYKVRLVPWSLVNAFAIPGGHIYVTKGMLDFALSEAELVSVIGHEMSHVDLRHCIERIQYAHRAKKLGGRILEGITQLSYMFFSIGYSDELELEADRHGMILAEATNYHPQGGQLLFDRLRKIYEGKKLESRTLKKEIGEMIRGGFADYFQSHPGYDERIKSLGRIMDEQGFDLAEHRYYVGKQNLTLRQARIDSVIKEEFVTGSIYPLPTEP